MTDVCQVQQIFKLIKNKASLCPNDQIYDLCYIPLDSWNIRGVVSRICQATRFNCLPLSYTSTAQHSARASGESRCEVPSTAHTKIITWSITLLHMVELELSFYFPCISPTAEKSMKGMMHGESTQLGMTATLPFVTGVG